MNELFETQISNARWMAYDLPGNVGWILYLYSLVKCLRQGVTVFGVVACVPALLMLIGVGELIGERIARLDRLLPRIRLLRGFGALTLGGIVGAVVGVFGLTIGMDGRISAGLLVGGVLCAIFAGLIYGGYKRKRID